MNWNIFLLELGVSGDKVWSVCNHPSVVEKFVLINHIRLSSLQKHLQLRNIEVHAAVCACCFTIALVPQESSLNSNRTLVGSVCLGPQVGSRRVVPSGCTVGQVEVTVVTTVMTPSEEQTATTGVRG